MPKHWKRAGQADRRACASEQWLTSAAGFDDESLARLGVVLDKVVHGEGKAPTAVATSFLEAAEGYGGSPNCARRWPQPRRPPVRPRPPATTGRSEEPYVLCRTRSMGGLRKDPPLERRGARPAAGR